MHQSSKLEQVDSTQSLIKFKTEPNLNPHASFYFNPEIYFPCKFCRHAFSTVDSLLKHKRRKHSAALLKNIKVIIFEERFVQDEVNEIKSENKTHHKTTREFQETESETSFLRSLDSIANNSESNANYNSTKSNPFVPLQRMTGKQIQDAKINLKNPAFRKRTSGFNSEIKLENEREISDLDPNLEQSNNEEECFTKEEYNTEPLISPAGSSTLETEAPQRRYNTIRECNKTRKNYAETEELQCAKCAQVFFTQIEWEDHHNLLCKEPEPAWNVEPGANITDLSFDLETDQEWSGNSSENSNTGDEFSGEDIAADIPKRSKKNPNKKDFPENRQKLSCPTCKKKFVGGKSALKSHVATHANPENRERKFACEICGSSFYTSSVLHNHGKTHSEERPFKCTTCPSAFKKKFDLKIHERLIHSHSEHNIFECLLGSEKCTLKFPTRARMISHCRKEHPEILSSSKIPCSLCSKTFWVNSDLKYHMISHSEVRPFKCTEEGCKRTFTVKGNLVEHLRTHTGEKPFQCDGCGSTFWKKWSFIKHCRMSCPKKATAEPGK